MQLKEIVDCFQHLTITDKRCMTEEFAELVFLNSEIAEWMRILVAFLGPPSKPEGQIPSESDLKLTAATGGIRTDQTLFEKEFEETIIIAKFWPWKDRSHTTLRMAMLLK